MRIQRMDNNTIGRQAAAAELWLKLSGRAEKNASEDAAEAATVEKRASSAEIIAALLSKNPNATGAATAAAFAIPAAVAGYKLEKRRNMSAAGGSSPAQTAAQEQLRAKGDKANLLDKLRARSADSNAQHPGRVGAAGALLYGAGPAYLGFHAGKRLSDALR